MNALFPSMLLVDMIVLTLVLLPRLQNDRQSRSDEPRRPTEELHIKASKKHKQ